METLRLPFRRQKDSSVPLAEEPVVSGDFAHAVLQDFYFSFHHSQGQPKLQTDLLVFLANQYKDVFPKDKRGDLFEFKKRLNASISVLNIPSKHTYRIGEGDHLDQKAAQDMMGGFQSMWDTQLNIFEGVLYKPHWLRRAETGPYFKNAVRSSSKLSPEKLLLRIALGCLEKDILYQDKNHPRPNRFEIGQAHESFFRTYAVLKKPTQTPRFDTLYAQIGELVQNGANEELTSSFNLLVSLWKENHPGEEFFAASAA